MEYEHKGVKIVFDAEKGKFSASINGKQESRGSLDAIKKAIDKVDAFVPFVALREYATFSGPAYSEVTVVGIKKARVSKYAYRQDADDWLLSTGYQERSVYANTPENIAALNERSALRKAQEVERNALSEKHKAEREAIDAKIVLLRPNVAA